MAEHTVQAERADLEVAGTGTETAKADGISIEVESVAGPISIVRVTQARAQMMQHC
jgi:hypothetical protein